MTSTHREDQPILEVGEGLVALVTVIFSGVGVLSHLLVTVCIRVSLVETVLRLNKRNGCFAAEVVRFVSMTKV